MVMVKNTHIGATYVTNRPTLRYGMNYVNAMTRKNRLKKNLNSFQSKSGRKVRIEYF